LSFLVRCRSGRLAWALVFGVFLLSVSAAPVLAGLPPAHPESEIAPESLTQGGQGLPDGTDVARGLAAAELEESETELRLEGPSMVAERAESVTAYEDVDPAEAADLLRAEFAEVLTALNADPARLLSSGELVRTLPGGQAGVVSIGGAPKILDAGIPVKVEAESGEKEQVDLSLVEDGDGSFVPKNPVIEVALPAEVDGTVEVGDSGLGIRQLGADDSGDALLFGDKSLLYPDADTDTDLLVAPISRGVELFSQLRSAESPEELRFQVTMPSGAELVPGGSGGAEVRRGSERLAEIPFPIAVDAQGTDVPVTMEVVGDTLVLRVPHRDADFAYPILVDPTLNEYWYDGASWYNGANLGVLTDGTWQWGANAAWAYGSSACMYACWGSGRGLYVTAVNGNKGPGEFGQWSYTPPGATSFLTQAWIYPFFRDNHGCSKEAYGQPHDYSGFWTGSGWGALNQNHAHLYGSSYLAGGGRSLIIGVGTAGGIQIPCWRDIVAGGVSVLVTDPEAPTWTTAPSAPDTWTDTAVVPISGAAYDPGLGVKYFNLYKSPSNGRTYDFIGNSERACSGLRSNPCGSSWSSSITNYNPAALPNGVNLLTVFAYDALAIEHNSQGLPVRVKVDHTAPQISFSGELFTKEPKNFSGQVTATDGSSASLATAQSGLKSVKIYLDGVLAGRFPDEDSPPACNKPQEGFNIASCQFNVPVELAKSLSGQHTLKVVALDSLNHTAEKSVTLELPVDKAAPTLTVTGALKTAAGKWVKPEELSATLKGEDPGGTGVTKAELLVDGKTVGSPFTQECYEGGCKLEKAFKAALSASGGLAAVATMAAHPSITERYFSLWLDMQTPASSRAGYELRFERVATDTYDVTLSKWQAGSETVLASKAGVAFVNGDSLALVDGGATVSAWTDTGTEFTQLLGAGDSTFEGGNAGLEGAGNIVRLNNFKAAELVPQPAGIGEQLATLPITESFDGSASSLERFDTQWSTMGWASGSTAKGAGTTTGWRPVNAFPTVNGAFYNLSLVGAGARSVKAIVKDGAGNEANSNWTVSVDPADPTLAPVTAPEVSNDWAPQLKSFKLEYSASDAHSGIKKIEVRRPAVGGVPLTSFPVNSACTSTCPATVSGSATISTENMAQGVDTVTVKAYDAAGRVSSSQSIAVHVDRSGPTIGKAAGPLFTPAGGLIGLVTDLELEVGDKGGGVGSLEFLLDGEVAETLNSEEIAELGGTETCSGEMCQLKFSAAPLVGGGGEPGAHEVELVVTDKAGHSVSIENDVVIDTRVPELDLTGSLMDTLGEELDGDPVRLDVVADDGNGEYDSGMADLEVAVDGVPLEGFDPGGEVTESFIYDENVWGQGPRTLSVTATDQAGNVELEELHVNEPLNVVAPPCPSLEAEVLSGGEDSGASSVIADIEATIPEALEPSETGAEGQLDPAVTSETEGVSLNEMGIDVVAAEAGGGIEDTASGSFTVGQAACLQPLETSIDALKPTIVNDVGVVYPNSAPDTDTVVRPTAAGTAVVQRVRGEDAPSEFSWKVQLEPGQELVELEDGSIAVVDPEGIDLDPESIPPAPQKGMAILTDAEAQIEQAEHDLAAANEELTGEVAMVIPAPMALDDEEKVTPGILRIVGATVVVAELPPGTLADAEALIILMSPAAEPETMCMAVMANAPQYAAAACEDEDIENESEEGIGAPFSLKQLAQTGDPAFNAYLLGAIEESEQFGGASASEIQEYPGGETRRQKQYCEGHRDRCKKYRVDGGLAWIAQNQLFNNPDGDSHMANAFKHSLWNALMKVTYLQGPGVRQGWVWAEMHEARKYYPNYPRVVERKSSQMDILNNSVGLWHAATNDLDSCEGIRYRSVRARYIGTKVEPFPWSERVDYEFNNPVYRKLKSFPNGPGAPGYRVTPTGKHCDEIRIAWGGLSFPINPFDPPLGIEIE
jgi:Domain of unknown function (DUF6973)